MGIETRADDAAATMLIGSIDHAETHACVMAERSLLAALQADCHSPVAALASLSGEMLTLRAELLAEDGSARVSGWVEGRWARNWAQGWRSTCSTVRRPRCAACSPGAKPAMAIVVIRPEPGHAATIAALEDAGLAARSLPFFVAGRWIGLRPIPRPSTRCSSPARRASGWRDRGWPG